MEAILKTDLRKVLAASTPLVVDLGCGRRKHPNALGIDKFDLPGVDIVADIQQGLSFLPDRCADYVRCRSVLEHLNDFPAVVREIT